MPILLAGKMNDRRIRQNRILDLVSRQRIPTQQWLADLLRKEGVEATQSTLSKDIKDLGLVKAPDEDGGVYYCVPTQVAPPNRQDVLRRELADFMIACERAGSLLVIKTTAGNASGVCAAIDGAKWPEPVGTVAGDDTIFIACRAPAQAKQLQECIQGIVRGTGR